MLYPQDYDNFESDSQLDNHFRERKPDETFCSLKLNARDKSIDGSQFIFPPQEVSNLGLDSSHEINDDTECSSLRSVSENKLQSSFCSQSSAGSIGQLVKKLETTSKLRNTNSEKTRITDSKNFEKNHLALSESSIDIEECLRNSMASSISTVFEGQANRKRLPVWESTPIDVCKSDFYRRNQVSRPAQLKSLSRQGLGIALKDSGSGNSESGESSSSTNNSPNINVLMQQLQELLAVNDNPLLLPLIIQLLNGQSTNASSDNQLQKLAGQMKGLDGRIVSSGDQTASDPVKLVDARHEPGHSSSSESSSSRFCLPNPSRRSRTSDDPKELRLLREGIKNHVNAKRGMGIEDGTERDEFEKKFCSAEDFVWEVQTVGKFYNTMESEVKPSKEKFRSDQIMEVEKRASSRSSVLSSSSRATSSLPSSMPSMVRPVSPSTSYKRTSRSKLSSRSGSSSMSSSSPAALTQSLSTLYVKNKSFKQQLSDVFKFLINLDGRGKTEDVDCLGGDVTITLDDDEKDAFENANNNEIGWLLKSVSQTDVGQVLAHQTLDGLRVPFMIQTNSVMKDLHPVTTKEKLQTLKSWDDDDLLSVSAYINPSEVCKVAKAREEKNEPTTYFEIENPVTSPITSSDYCSINQSTCEEDQKTISGKSSMDTRAFTVQTKDECVQVDSGDLRGFEERIFSSPRHIGKSFESPPINLKKKLEPSGHFKKLSNGLFRHDERVCGAFTPEELSLECPLTPSSSGKSSLSTVPKKIDSNGNVIMSAPNQWTIMFETEKVKVNSPNEIQKNLQPRKHQLRESLEDHHKLKSSMNRANPSLGKPKVFGSAADRQNFDKKDAASKGFINGPKVIQGIKQTQLSNGLKVRSRTLESSKGRTVVKQQNGKIQRKVSMPTT